MGRNCFHSLNGISGAQTGVDRGALDAALAPDFPCGGRCPQYGERQEFALANIPIHIEPLPRLTHEAADLMQTMRSAADLVTRHEFHQRLI